jgi:hypothetical protein
MAQDGDSGYRTTLPAEQLLEVSRVRQLLVLRWVLRLGLVPGLRS